MKLRSSDIVKKSFQSSSQASKLGKKHYLSGMVFGATKKISNKQQIYG